MKGKYHFLKPSSPEIAAAQVGINKEDWTCLDDSGSESDALQIMRKDHFDVVPVIRPDRSVHSFYTTCIWGSYTMDQLLKCEITSDERIYYLTQIQDVVTQFVRKERNFFFLDDHSEIVGLITIGNLNSRDVYLYTYFQIINLERALGQLIYNCGINDSELIELFEQRTNSNNSTEALERFNEDNARGFDNRFLEYIYLTDLCWIYKNNEDLLNTLGVTRKYLIAAIGKINNTRIAVAHPNKSLVPNRKSLLDLHKSYQYMDELMEKLSA